MSLDLHHRTQQIYSAYSLDSLCQDQNQVKLIKFNTLSPENTQHQMDPNQRPSTKDNDNLKYLSVADLAHDNPIDANKKFPWPTFFTSKTHLTSASNLSSTGSQRSQQRAHTSEPFQVLWHRLSFVVNVSTYDQLIEQALSRARSLLTGPLGRSTSTTQAEHAEHEPKSHYTSGESLTHYRQPSLSRSSNKRVVFDNLNGHIKSGQISAILGPSGSGKTSLLNAICGKLDNYRGSIQLIGGGQSRMRLSHIPQKDYLIENLTVRENLLYSSKILNTNRSFDHEANILRVVKMLSLTNCFHSSAANISGGEYKRVSIAQELLKQPDILILDEPTSGLDSLNCKKLIKSLAQLIEASRQGTINPIAIVMTIHQPDVDIFHMFDHVYCIAKGGSVIFDGHPSEVMSTIRDHAALPTSFDALNSLSSNPANLLIEIASGEFYGKEPIELLAKCQRKKFEMQLLNSQTSLTPKMGHNNNLFGHYHSPNDSTNNLTIMAGQNPDNCDQSHIYFTPKPYDLSSSSTISTTSSYTNKAQLVRDKRLNAKNDHSGQFWYHTNLLARRAFTSTIRDSLMTVIALVFHLAIPFVMWTVYNPEIGKVKACPMVQREFDIIALASNNTLTKMENLQEQLIIGLECSTMFYLSTYSFSMCSLSVAALAFPLNMHILLKEVRNGWYSLPSYVVAKSFANFPFEVLFPVISMVVIYIMLGMPSSYLEWRLWAIALVTALVSMISHTQGLIFGALCMDSVQTAIFLASSSTLPLTLLSGFTARIKRMPDILQKLSWLSLYRYSSDSMNIIRFGFDTCPCDTSTDDYLRTQQPVFSDVPSQMKSLITYYLANPSTTTSDNITSTVSNHTSLINTIPHTSQELILNSTERSSLLGKLDNGEVDLFDRMADLIARSFSYGRDITNCDYVRSELLVTSGAPKDEFLPFLFGGMVALLILAKLILFFTVQFKVGSRV